MASPAFLSPTSPPRAATRSAYIGERLLRTNRGTERRNVLIVGSEAISRSLETYFRQHPRAGYSVRGFIDEAVVAGGDVLGQVQNLSRIALAEFVDEIILSGRCEPEWVCRVVAEAQRIGLGVRLIPDLFGLDPKLVTVDRLGGLPALSLHGQRASGLRLGLKRTMDVIVSAVVVAVGAPWLAVIAVLIAATSRGPILYRAWRVGRKGTSFLCYKFRTMVADADAGKALLRAQNERQGPIFKIANDPRVTRVGRWLRRYSLDELPQFWNVLRGEMSLVGPRPHPLDDFERYDLEHLRRLEVKPGITGLWQVTARSDPSFQRNMALDLEYIERWNLWLDLRILGRTLAVVVRGNGT
jgi:exopolysaccharide biosynthesis polyprenyl glycosylphosphotransferase